MRHSVVKRRGILSIFKNTHLYKQVLVFVGDEISLKLQSSAQLASTVMCSCWICNVIISPSL
jgi:hypothetical protein